MAGPTFSEAVAAQHERIDVDAWDSISVVGDVHGCRETLDRLLARLDPGPRDLVVFVGDLVRKGPDSAGVLERVRANDNFRSVRGNNEQKLLAGTEPPAGLDDADLAYLASLPLAISWEGGLVVHGGVDHRKPLAAHDPGDLLELRSLADGGYERPYWFERRAESPRVYFGHTVLAEPLATDWAVGLDTGCVYGGRLTAYDRAAGDFVAVDPPETYRSRSTDSIVEPAPARGRIDR